MVGIFLAFWGSESRRFGVMGGERTMHDMHVSWKGSAGLVSWKDLEGLEFWLVGWLVGWV